MYLNFCGTAGKYQLPLGCEVDIKTSTPGFNHVVPTVFYRRPDGRKDEHFCFYSHFNSSYTVGKAQCGRSELIW